MPRRPARLHVALQKSSWENVSDWYASAVARSGSYQQTVIFPNALRLLSPQRDGKYLDIACGEGSFANMMAKKIRASAIGIDASPSLIAHAIKQATTQTEFMVADAAYFSERFSPSSFDGVTCILALQNMKTLEPVFREVARVLKQHAPFVIVLNHPCFRPPRQSGWGWDEQRKIQYRRIDRYLSSYEMPILAHPGSSPNVKTYSYHRPLSVYVDALAKTGFVVDAMEEWTSPKKSDLGPRAKAENAARDEFPLFLAFRARLA